MKKKPKIYIIANNKGGITKTTTSVNLAVAFAEMFPEKKILLLDTDGQGNSSQSFGINADDLETPTMANVLTGEATLDEIIFKPDNTDLANLYLAPANIDLNFLEFDFIMGRKRLERPSLMLKEAIEKSQTDFDFIFVDTPPGFGLMATNFLTLPAKILIPFEPETFAFTGLVRLLDQIEDMQLENKELSVAGILCVKVQLRTNLHKELIEQTKMIAAKRGYRIMNTMIPSSIKFANAVAYDQVPALLGEENTTEIVQSYKRLAQELLYLEEVE
ncbi:ParA family protein [Thermoactinomyces daqus]|uniref:ParA family protein n=1 Tax=Thermoactinomyces daqus TaxID=1329516 RepID=A0A7W1XDC4_9BACL|nr:ParA family protein [Thermoactinomyces daqus]MBA4544596.1 ParA family protein [Thermoactinomyces daqus]